ncbi:hypothetical protein CYLTODRAFT_354310 [Cylindrobasidium torrendii FP15055 ss-10]|uniref:Uncharacterized protein n=1 Tax=Cylindrobasidium torrendii FP15055 ss-10 TaxID=1314674 RepID=A0A0D7B9F6_9AGAR|nr:hypothetical protein CYLTODRAFT_354310 [Cylindrobasidium torrendii FP15055 ss-10]
MVLISTTTSVRNTLKDCVDSSLTPIAEDACPNSYAYAYDESSGTALWTCPTANKADYTITFC